MVAGEKKVEIYRFLEKTVALGGRRAAGTD